MATSIYHQRLLDKRKTNNLCISCGKPLDREGVNCTECRQKINKEVAETRHWYQDNGICPRCRKNTIEGDEKVCPECNAKNANMTAKRRGENREEYNEKQKIIHRNLYYKRIEQGICTRCGKRKTDYGYKTCGICRAKDAEYKRIKYGKPNRSERCEQGLCYFCDNPVMEGYKVCEKHYQTCLQNLDNEKCREVRQRFKDIDHRRINSKNKANN